MSMEGKGTTGSFVCSWPRSMAGHYSLSKFCPSKLVITLLTSVEPTLAPMAGNETPTQQGTLGRGGGQGTLLNTTPSWGTIHILIGYRFQPTIKQTHPEITIIPVSIANKN